MVLGDRSFLSSKFNDILFKVVDTSTGASPDGFQKSDVPIFALLESSEKLDIKAKSLSVEDFKLIDIDNFLAFQVHHVLSDYESDALADFSRFLGFMDEAPGIYTPPGMRLNSAVHWIATRDMMDAICKTIYPFIPKSIDGSTFAGLLSHRLNVYRYLGSNQQFKPHVDGEWPGYYFDTELSALNTWSALTSKLSMLIYLTNHSSDSGVTRLYSGNKFVDIVPKKGSALFFRHGTSPSSVLHSGQPPRHSDEEKIVIRVNVMYKDASQ